VFNHQDAIREAPWLFQCRVLTEPLHKRLSDLALLRPEKLAELVLNPADRIVQMPVRFWIEQIRSVGKGVGSEGHAGTDMSRPRTTSGAIAFCSAVRLRSSRTPLTTLATS
jgi:hypothetical protein